MGKQPLLFDFCYIDEQGHDPYQLVVERNAKSIDNALLFERLYQLMESLVKSESEHVYFNDLSPVLDYHYWRFLPRFSFVSELAVLYEDLKQTGHLVNIKLNAFIEYWLERMGTNSAIYEGTVRLTALADKNLAERLNVPVGTPYNYMPEPVTDLEAYQRLKFYRGAQVCEHYISDFIQTYKEPTAEIYASELAPINTFINEINSTQVKIAFERADNDHSREYLRLIHGYYENHRCEQAMGNTAAMVYGKYVLYKKWLEDRMRESFSNNKARGLPHLEPAKVSPDFILGQELFNVLYQRNLLSDFFQVPAPPVKGRFWHDIEDRETDDPAKVVRISPIFIRQSRRANTEDFPLVLDQVNIIADKRSKAYQHFVDDLIACLGQMINFHRTLHQPEERKEDHYQLIEIAENFISWLKATNQPKPGLAIPAESGVLASKVKQTNIQVLDELKQRTVNLPDILHLRAPAVGYRLTDEDKKILFDTYAKLDDILKEVAAFINIRFPGCKRHVKAWNDIDFDTKIGDFKIRTTDREQIKREWQKGMFDLISLIKILRNETVLLVSESQNSTTAEPLKEISSDYPLDHFTNKEVIPNQDLVAQTISFFETGGGKGLFTPLEILNLINKQQQFVMLNHQNGEFVIQHLKNLPLAERKKHSLCGFLLKWFGGYPVNNLNEELNETLKLIQAEFLNYKDNTAEKSYCRADQAMRNKFEKFGFAFTTSINHGIDVNELLAAMELDEPEVAVFQNFAQLFNAAIKDGLIESFSERKDFLIAQTAYNYQFNVWLQTYKDWEYRNEDQYQDLLTKSIFEEFLIYRKQKYTLPVLEISTSPNNPVPRIAQKLTIKQVALICHYTDRTITRSVAKSVVVEYGYTSGDSLFNDYTYFRSKANRLAAEPTKRKNANKLQLFESVQLYLANHPTAKDKIDADLAILRAAIEKENSTL